MIRPTHGAVIRLIFTPAAYLMTTCPPQASPHPHFALHYAKTRSEQHVSRFQPSCHFKRCHICERDTTGMRLDEGGPLSRFLSRQGWLRLFHCAIHHSADTVTKWCSMSSKSLVMSFNHSSPGGQIWKREKKNTADMFWLQKTIWSPSHYSLPLTSVSG